MTTATHVPLEEYLTTSYEPDCDYLDGELEERNVGEYDHNVIQRAIDNWFHSHRKEWSVRSVSEQRTRLTPTRYRIPDVSVFRRDTPIEQVFTKPQLIAIEVLSPEDRHSRMQLRIEDYIQFQVSNIWVVDPITREGFDCSTGSWVKRERFEVADTPIYLSLNELFSELDAEEA
jgi:Uma2 family endonuclease